MISFPPRKARFHPSPPARGREGFPEATGRRAGECIAAPADPSPRHPGPGVGRRAGARVPSSSPPRLLPASSRPGSGAPLRWGRFSDLLREPGYFWLARGDVGEGRCQGAASPSSPPLSVAGGRSDLSTPLGAGPIEEPTRGAQLAFPPLR